MTWLLKRLAIKPLCRWQKRLLVSLVIALLVSLSVGAVFIFAPHWIWPKTGDHLNMLSADIENGEYVFHLSGCAACHSTAAKKDAPLAGGKRIRTPFGIITSTNITPDDEFGIGGWSRAEFADAVRQGISPQGVHYYPAFPYTSYIKMSDQDVVDIQSYIDQRIAPISEPNKSKVLPFPLNIRAGIGTWKLLYNQPAYVSDVSTYTEIEQRGAYLVEALGHCGECHTPRDTLGGLLRDQWMAGVPQGAFNPAPSLLNTRDAMGDWTDEEWLVFLQTGKLPNGEYTGGEMSHVIKEITSHLVRSDAEAMVAYFRTLNGEENR
ncbi:diheme cytochrome c-553 [Enterovibrio norvegicus]|uniref:c-type cytochrome n=1 Tax=Enterovibrio norvegicus TaxID=188144 RepID=UPI0002F6BC84|nr:cytochrome c [Enterovibrio norvegicus]OEF62586.1 diheme cytochrome c-553 [Enterovibrio norvegicus]